MNKLKISKDLPLPNETVTQKLAWLGTIEKAKGEDPKLLRKEIAKLRSELAKGQVTDSSRTVSDSAQKRAVELSVRDAIALKDKEIFDMQGEWLKQMDNWFSILAAVGETMKAWKQEQLRRKPKKASAGVSPARNSIIPRHKEAPVSHFQSALPADADRDTVSDGPITGPEQRILDGIAWTESIGIPNPSNEIAAFLAGYAHCRSAGYTNPRASLRGRGLITYSSGKITLTAAGRALAHAPETPLSQEELHRAVLEKLHGPERRVLQPLLKSYPDGVSNTDLSAAAGYAHERSAGYTNPRSRLRSFGLVEYEDGEVKASNILFI